MKLLFSEAVPDPEHYVYPYAIWAFLEDNETPATAFRAGFLPSSPHLDRFYLVRQIRVPLNGWKPNSENRRVLRKMMGTELRRWSREEFDYSEERRGRWLAWAKERLGPDVMPGDRLDRLLSGRVVSHLLTLIDSTSGRELGVALLYLEPPEVAYYYYAFYESTDDRRHLGMGLMTRAVEQFAELGYQHLYVGTCYREEALYKTQFEQVEFFNGFAWSNQLAELKHLIRIPLAGKHRLETAEFLALQGRTLSELAAESPVRWIGPSAD